MALGVASVVNGVTAYVIVVVASRGLETPGFAAFSVAWSVWALSVALLVFPIQHWIIWRSAVDRGTAGVRSVFPRVLGLIIGVVAVLWLAGSSERLFPSDGAWGPILAAIGATSAVLGVGRGTLGARNRYRDVAWVLGSENVLRLVALVAVLAVTVDAQIAVLTLAVGVLALAPFVRHLTLDAEGEPGDVSVLAELGALAGAMALAQVLVQFPPAFAEWLGEPPEAVSAIFATFSLGRAPLLVILAVSARLTDPLTRFLSGTGDQVRRTLARGIGVMAAVVAIAGVLGYLIGPQLVTWFFGPGRALGAGETALISTGLAMASAGVVVTLGLMVRGSNRLAALYWLVALVVAVASALLGTGVPMSFFIAEVLAVTASTATLWSLTTRASVTG